MPNLIHPPARNKLYCSYSNCNFKNGEIIGSLLRLQSEELEAGMDCLVCKSSPTGIKDAVGYILFYFSKTILSNSFQAL